MTRRTTLSREAQIETQRRAEIATRAAAMTDAEIAMELVSIQTEIATMDHETRVSPNNVEMRRWHDVQWISIGRRQDVYRAELAARRSADIDENDAPTDEQMDDLDRFYRALNATAADEVQALAEEHACLAARDAAMVFGADIEPF